MRLVDQPANKTLPGTETAQKKITGHHPAVKNSHHQKRRVTEFGSKGFPVEAVGMEPGQPVGRLGGYQRFQRFQVGRREQPRPVTHRTEFPTRPGRRLPELLAIQHIKNDPIDPFDYPPQKRIPVLYIDQRLDNQSVHMHPFLIVNHAL
jgi:hypothetical protein